MIVRDIALILVSLTFAVAGVLHGRRNSFYRKPEDRNSGLLRVYYAALSLFGASVATYGFTAVKTGYGEVAVAALFVAAISLARFLTDWIDLRSRPGTIDWLRPVADALANLFTIALAIFVSLSKPHETALAWLCFLFGWMFIAKEFNFRIRDDFFLRRGGTRTTAQGGGGKKTDPVTSVLQAFFGRYVKSYFYICVGFAIVYLMLPILLPSVGGFSRGFGSGGADEIADVFALSLGSMTQLPAKVPVPVLIVAILQWAAGAAMVGLVLVRIYVATREK